jgi:hypothetical protein
VLKQVDKVQGRLEGRMREGRKEIEEQELGGWSLDDPG